MEYEYVNYINKLLKEYLESLEQGVFFGQNVLTGSRVSGIAKDLNTLPNIECMNTTNSENMLFGLGFGLSISGIPSIYLMKQHDFALLAFDQIVNTSRLLTNYSNLGSFIAIMVVVDSGFEGPQSNLNNLNDFHSISLKKIRLLNSMTAIEHAFKGRKETFEIFAVSQNFLKRKIFPENSREIVNGFAIEQNRKVFDDDAPILLNFGLITDCFIETIELFRNSFSTFHYIYQTTIDFKDNLVIVSKISKKKRKIVIMDSCKSINKISNEFVSLLREIGMTPLYIQRSDQEEWKKVAQDKFTVDQEIIAHYLGV